MTWVITTDRSLINTDLLSEIKFYNITYEGEFLGIRVDGCYLENDDIILGFLKSYNDAEKEIKLLFFQNVYTFYHSFRDLCEEIKEMEEMYEKKSSENFNEYWKKSSFFVDEVLKKCELEEISIDIYF